MLVGAALPPPLHGQSFVTGQVVEELKRLEQAVDLEVINTSPGTLQRSASYHRRRSISVANLLLRLLQARPGLRFYTILESGQGLWYNILAFSVCRLRGHNIFVHHHTAKHALLRSSIVALALRLAGRSAVHIVLSRAMAIDLTTRYSALDNVLISSNARYIAQPVRGGGYQRPERTTTLGLLSNLSLEKGVGIVLDSLEAARQRGCDVRLILAGPIVDSRTASLIEGAQRRFGSALSVWGPTYGIDKERFFEEVDVFLFPSMYKFEAQPISVLEALAWACPVIATDRGYISELLQGVGIVAAPDTFATCVADQLQRWTANPNSFAEICRRSGRRYQQLLSASNAEYRLFIQRMTD